MRYRGAVVCAEITVQPLLQFVPSFRLFNVSHLVRVIDIQLSRKTTPHRPQGKTVTLNEMLRLLDRKLVGKNPKQITGKKNLSNFPPGHLTL